MKQEVAVLTPGLKLDILVIIFGWSGAIDKNLKKYSEIYEKLGYSTLRYTAKYRGLGKSIYGPNKDDVKEFEATFKPLFENKKLNFVIHCLSMNGILTLVSLLNQNGYSGLLTRTIGMIFDSCPVHTDKEDTYRQVLEYQLGKYFDDSFIGYLEQKISLWLLVKKHNFDVYDVFFKHKILGYELKELIQYKFLKDHPEMPSKQLYLYSDADKICDSKQITNFHNHQSKIGKQVHFQNFVDSPHCGHFQKYPQEYKRFIEQFLISLKETSKF